MLKNKKGVIGSIISVFVMILVVAILAGLTFLFVAQLKAQALPVSYKTGYVINESSWVNQTAYVSNWASNTSNFGRIVITQLYNTSSSTLIALGNVTVIPANNSWKSTDYYLNSTAVQVTYNYLYTDPNVPSAWNAANNTEAAGYTVVGYLPLIFLAIIFGAILTLVLKIILPFINLGQSVGGGNGEF